MKHRLKDERIWKDETWQSGLHTPTYQVQSLEYEKTFHDSDRAASAIVLEQISESSSAQLGDPFRVVRDVATSWPNIVGYEHNKPNKLKRRRRSPLVLWVVSPPCRFLMEPADGWKSAEPWGLHLCAVAQGNNPDCDWLESLALRSQAYISQPSNGSVSQTHICCWSFGWKT